VQRKNIILCGEAEMDLEPTKACTRGSHGLLLAKVNKKTGALF